MNHDTHKNDAPVQDTAHGQLLDHEYDGIREYDNPTPGWWHVLFLFFIVFSAFYLFIAQFSPAYVTPEQALVKAQNEEFEKLFADVGVLENDPGTLLTMMNEEKWVQLASAVYASNCSSCHAAGGAGIVGPNLTDDHWINVAKVEDIYDVIALGAGNGAMPAWNNRLNNNEIVLLSSYLASLRGTNPAGALPADGEAIEPWPEVAATDG